MGTLSLRDAIGDLDRLAEHYGAVHEGAKKALMQGGAAGMDAAAGTGGGGLPDFGQNDLFGKIGDQLQQSTADLLRQSMAAANARPVPQQSKSAMSGADQENVGVVIDGEAHRVGDE